MSLTGTPLLILMAACFVGAFAALVVFWPRLAGRRALPVLGRVGALLVVNVLLVMTAAIGLNDQYLFFVDWADLTGAGGTQASVAAHAGSAAASVFTAQAASRTAPFPLTAPAGALPPLPGAVTQQNGLLTFQVHGQASGLSGEVMVQLPQSYLDPAHKAVLYPVLSAYPTYPGSPEALFRNFDLSAGLVSAVKAHQIADSLLVVPVTSFPSGADTECINGPSGTPQVETWLTKDVPQWIAAHFRVTLDRAAWATLGVSAGAYCASAMAYLHPELFSSAISIAGYYEAKFDAARPYAPGDPAFARYNLVDGAKSTPPRIAMFVQSSKTDGVSGPSTTRFLAAAHPPLAIDAQISPTGGHRWAEWKPVLPVSLAWLGRIAPGFAPGT